MEIETRNAIIENTMLGFEDHGIFTCFIELDYGGISQSFGGYSIKDDFIEQVLKTLRLDKWEDLKGQKIRAKTTNTKVHAIGHFLEDRWFNPEEYYKEKDKEEGEKK